MKTKIQITLITFITILFSANFAGAENIEFTIQLSPAGKFVAKTNDVQGFATKKESGYIAENIIVDLKNLKTGIQLRDQHTLDKLEAKKFPQIKLIKAEGNDGKGSGTIEIRGIQKPIEGTFEINNNKLTAEFELKMSDFEIKGIKYMGVGAKDTVKVKAIIPVK